MSALANPAVIAGVAVAGGTVVASVISAWENRHARREVKEQQALAREVATIIQGNGKGNVSEMLEFVCDEVAYIRARVDEHLEDNDRHVHAKASR